MATFLQAVERARNDGELPVTGAVSLRDLDRRYDPLPHGSGRALIDKMYRKAAKVPWAVILCRFKGEAADPAREGPVERLYHEAFRSRTGGLVEYWRDVSLGKVDVSASRVFGWVEVDIPRNKANTGSGTTRSTLVDAAIRAVRLAGDDPLTGYHSQLSVYIENWSINGVPPGLDWSDPVWGKYWIDGSADGRGKVSLTPPHNGNITAHEMGHSFGMGHDLGPNLIAEYQDPCCVMSQQNAFTHPTWNVAFGPAVCLPHLVQRGWMYPRRLYVDGGNWMTLPDGISLPLAALNDPSARANLGIKLSFARGPGTAWDYYLQYVTPTDWNRGLGNSFVFIRRMAPYGNAQTPAHLGTIEVPATTGVTNQFVEPSGNVRFTVERFDSQARILRVGAVRL
jgi:hypothetical protein